jgi:hypothetical protein
MRYAGRNVDKIPGLGGEVFFQSFAIHMPDLPLRTWMADSWPSCLCALARAPGGMITLCRWIFRAPTESAEIAGAYKRACLPVNSFAARTVRHEVLRFLFSVIIDPTSILERTSHLGEGNQLRQSSSTGWRGSGAFR